MPTKAFATLITAALIVLALPVFASQREVYAKNGYDWSVVAQQIATLRQQGPSTEGIYYAPAPPTRTIGDSFPTVFGGMHDLTISQTPQDEGSLDGSDVPLAASVLRKAPNRIIGLWSVRTADLDSQVAMFKTAGYRESYRWEGPQTLVILFER